MRNKLITILFVSIFLMSLVSAYEPHKQNTELQFSFTSNNATQCNVTTANTPQGILLINQISTKSGQTFNNTINESVFSELGNYCFNIVCTDGVNIQGGSVCREITLNGKSQADGIVVVVFSLIFIAIMGFGIVHFLKCLARVIEFDMDLIDTAIMMSTYFAMWFFYYFAKEYLGNAIINEMLEIAISVGAITHVFLAMVGFFISYIMTQLRFKQKQRTTY